jgi:aspartyl-tRNA synthetase
VIAFPKSGTGVDPVFKSPSISTEEALKEYGLRMLEGAKGDEGGEKR